MADRFDKFTEKARQVLLFAQEEAVRMNRKYIGAEHFLLALIRENHTIANVALAKLVADAGQARSTLVLAIGRGDLPVSGEIALTPQSKATIEFAFDEAKRRGHEYVDPGHLLLGLVRATDTTNIWEIVGIDPDALRLEVQRIYTSSTGAF